MVLITALHNSLKWECYSQLCTRLFMKLCWKLWEFFSACILLWKAQAKLWTNLKLLNGIPSKAKSNQVSNQDHDNSGVLDRPQKQFFRNDLFQRLVQNKDICDYCFLCLRLRSSSEILEEGQMNTLRAGGIVTFKTWRYDCIYSGGMEDHVDHGWSNVKTSPFLLCLEHRYVHNLLLKLLRLALTQEHLDSSISSFS